MAQTVAASPEQGDLGRLLQTEHRLSERLDAARAAAATLLAQAQQDIEREDAALEALVAEATRRLDEELAAEGQQRAAEIAASAAGQVEAFGRVPPARLAAVARALAERFLIEDGAA